MGWNVGQPSADSCQVKGDLAVQKGDVSEVSESCVGWDEITSSIYVCNYVAQLFAVDELFDM
jgi:hypothetical protein